MKISILNAAQKDLLVGYRFYENQDAGLGNYFLDSLFADIDSLQIYAGIHGIHFGRYYRMLAQRFPYAVYYRIIDDAVVVYAVLDCRRRPGRIQQRLR